MVCVAVVALADAVVDVAAIAVAVVGRLVHGF